MRFFKYGLFAAQIQVVPLNLPLKITWPVSSYDVKKISSRHSHVVHMKEVNAHL